MRAFHGDPKIKAKYLRRLHAHAAADQIVKGVYWEKGKGCAVGCTVHSSDHLAYEAELGIPQALARLEDRLFEGMPAKDAKEWPLEFLSAFKPGVDYGLVQWKFLHWNLTENLSDGGDTRVRAAIDQAAAVLVAPMQGLAIDLSAAWSAASAAWSAASAARSAASAARSAAGSATYLKMAQKLRALIVEEGEKP